MGKSINYIGSKANLLEFLHTNIKNTVSSFLDEMSFCDLFAGTGVVADSFKGKVKKIISNDLEYYSYILNHNLLLNRYKPSFFKRYFDLLNLLEPCNEGIIYKNYALGSGSGRNYFSDENAKFIDAVRVQIEQWHTTNEIDDEGYFFLLASLLQSADKVANTTSIYGAFLKDLKKSARVKMQIVPAHYISFSQKSELYNQDANTLVRKVGGDILYIDPPYNHRQYGANYHILNTIARYDSVKVSGKTGIRDYVSSSYCKKREVYASFEQLICDAKFHYIFVSYNDEGYMKQEEIAKIMSKYGSYSFVQQEHKRFKSYKKYKSSTYEHLHILIKENY